MSEVDVLPAPGGAEQVPPHPLAFPRLPRGARTLPRIARAPETGAQPTPPAEPPTHRGRRSDIEQAAARQGKDLHKLADDLRDRLALVRDAGLTTGDTLAFSRAVRTYLDRFLLEDGIILAPVEKSAL